MKHTKESLARAFVLHNAIQRETKLLQRLIDNKAPEVLIKRSRELIHGFIYSFQRETSNDFDNTEFKF